MDREKGRGRRGKEDGEGDEEGGGGRRRGGEGLREGERGVGGGGGGGGGGGEVVHVYTLVPETFAFKYLCLSPLRVQWVSSYIYNIKTYACMYLCIRIYLSSIVRVCCIYLSNAYVNICMLLKMIK